MKNVISLKSMPKHETLSRPLPSQAKQSLQEKKSQAVREAINTDIDETLAPYAPRYGRKVYQQHKHTYILSINALNNNENPHGKSNTKCMENTIRSSKNIYIKREKERAEEQYTQIMN